MTTITRHTLFALMTGLLLAAASSAVASDPKALLVAPDPYCHDLPKFGFHSQNIYGFGERVTYVNWGGLAAQLGLEPGDVILSMNGFPLSYHGSWNDALRQALNNGGWVQLTVRDVRTGAIAYRQTFVGSPGYGPITPKSHVAAYHGPTMSHVVIGAGPITVKSKAHPHHSMNNQLKHLAKLFKDKD